MTRGERNLLTIVLLVAFALRLGHVLELRSDVLFEHPPLDEDRYVHEARLFAHDRPYEQRPFWQPPGILYLLGVLFRVAGDGLLFPRLVQVVVGTLVCALVFEIARRLFDVRVALSTAAVVALHGVAIFATGELLPATWACAFDLLALLLLLDARESPKHALGAGIALGVSAVFTPVILPFALFAGLLLVRRDEPRPVLAFAAGLVLPIAPIAWRNYEKSHELVLVSTNGGLNFFIGNNPEYFDTLSVRPGPHWPELAELPYRVARIDAPTKSSAWFFERGLAFWKAHPLQALGLYLRKLWLFFHGAEIPRDTDLYDVRRESFVLRALVGPRPFWFPDGLMIPLSLVGIATSLRQRVKLALPLLFVAAQAAFVALFFVSARYRVPSLPVLAMFAVVGALAIARAKGRPRALLASAFVALVVLLGLPAREAKMAFPAERDLYRGLAYRSLNEPLKAVDALRRASLADPNDARPLFELGVSLEAMGRPLDAAAAWERAALADPTELRPLRMASNARMRGGDVPGAIGDIESLVRGRTEARFAGDWMQLAALHAETKDPQGMLRALRSAVASDPGFVRSRLAAFEKAFREKVGDDALWATVEALVR